MKIQKFRLGYVWLIILMVLGNLILLSSWAHAMDHAELNAHMAPYFNQVVDSIYVAEGGVKARKPFGILSVPCSDYSDCRQVCFNTVRNNYHRWIAAGRAGDYIEFLAKRYCPVGAENDPTGLNKNWLRNVRAGLES